MLKQRGLIGLIIFYESYSSMYTPRNKLMVAAIKINTKGNAMDIAPDCMADKAYEPPPTNKTMAINP